MCEYLGFICSAHHQTQVTKTNPTLSICGVLYFYEASNRKKDVQKLRKEMVTNVHKRLNCLLVIELELPGASG